MNIKEIDIDILWVVTVALFGEHGAAALHIAYETAQQVGAKAWAEGYDEGYNDGYNDSCDDAEAEIIADAVDDLSKGYYDVTLGDIVMPDVERAAREVA